MLCLTDIQARPTKPSVASLTCFVVAVVVACLTEQVVRRCNVHARLADGACRINQEGSVSPAWILNKVGPCYLVQVGVEYGLERSLSVPDDHNYRDPHGLVDVGQDVVKCVLPVSPALEEDGFVE